MNNKPAKKVLNKSQKAADSLRGIWKDLPHAVQKELMKKLYCICGRAECPDCGAEE